MAETAHFDVAVERFAEHYTTVRGYIRQEVTRQNLIGHLPSGSVLKALDFGGGDGRDSMWLTEMGNNVFFLDESDEMRQRALQSFRIAPVQNRSRISMVDNLSDIESESLNLVLSHGVLMYEVDDPLEQLRSAEATLKPGGILSLLTKGREAAAQSVADSEKAEFEVTGKYTNRLGLPVRAYSFDELESMLRRANFQPQARYGVRLLSDGDQRPLNEVTDDELLKMVADETTASRDPRRMASAQMLHVIAKKN